MREQTRDDKIENCLVMIDAVNSLPERAFVPGLREWKCGSAACLGGWVAQHPHFQAKGVYPSSEGAPVCGGFSMRFRGGTITQINVASDEVSHNLFGNSFLFFSERSVERGVSPKQIALNRLNNALKVLLEG